MDVASSKLDKVLSVKCPLHKTQTSDILYVNASAVNHRACADCLYKVNDLPSTSVNIKKLF